MLATLIDCLTCSGTGATVHPAAGTHPCGRCRGHGVVQPSGASFTNRRTAHTAADAGRVTVCRCCAGTGSFTNPDTTECWTCLGTAVDLDTFDPGDVIPPRFGSLTRHARPPVIAHYAATVAVRISRHPGAALTAGAALLGLGTIWTSVGLVTDDDADLTAQVRAGLAHGTQLCHLAYRATRRIAGLVVVEATRTGYAVTTAASTQILPWLPPTYTPRLLNAPHP